MRYKDAGVDAAKADMLAEKVGMLAKKTQKDFVIKGIGGFSGIFGLPGDYRDPVFCVSTDGVGTKLKIAFETGIHDTVGIDLVAMNVNDIITTGAEPFIFVDYFSCSELDDDIYIDVISGIVKGCEIAGCALVAGETAQLPSFYKDKEYDLAGFCVGVCERKDLFDNTVDVGDIAVGIKSSGVHSNGFSLVRKVVEKKFGSYDVYIEELGKKLYEELLTPTRIYVDHIKALKTAGIKPKAVAHVTGGGLLGKPKRFLKKNTSLVLYRGSWEVPVIFRLIEKWGGIDEREMFKTFNMGLGLIVVFDKEEVDRACEVIKDVVGEEPLIIGEIIKGEKEVILWEASF